MTQTNLKHISTAAVIGAGSMGSGIAAHLANSGVKVHLLDISEENAAKGIERQVKQRGFLHSGLAKLVTPGSIEEHASRLGEAEWIVEAVFEDLDVKHQTFRTIEAHRTPGVPVSSNTSTIPLANLTEGFDTEFTQDFAIIHFFNPPRIMRLVELVRGENTKEDVAKKLTEICEQQLGKVVIDCRDTPGFIANRVGNYWMAVGADLALQRGIDPELADAAFGKPFGVPRTGIFGLFDYVGLQLVKPIWGSLLGALPESDAYHRHDITQSREFNELLDKGLTGRSGESGFYRGRGEVYDFEASDYRERRKPEDPALAEKSAKGLMSVDSTAGRYGRDVYLETLRYCCDTAPEIAEHIGAIDDAMAQGYGWKKGPFALADSIGVGWLAEQYDEAPALLESAVKAGGFYPERGKVLSSKGDVVDLPQRAGVVTVAEKTADAETIIENDSAVVRLLTDGIAVLSAKTSLGSCSPELLDVVSEATTRSDIKALVIAHDDPRAFSAGADLATLAKLAADRDEQGLYNLLRKGVEAFEALETAPFPVVAAVRGVALGGGAELMLHCDAVVAHCETRIGFPEPNVGLYPGWAGTVKTLERYVDAGLDNPHEAAFSFIMSAKPKPVANTGLLREGTDEIILSPDHVIARAFDVAAQLVDGYTAGNGPHRKLPLYSGKLEWTEGTETDQEIGAALAKVYEGEGETTEHDLGLRETENCAPVLVQPKMAERAAHMAKTRKPLKN